MVNTLYALETKEPILIETHYLNTTIYAENNLIAMHPKGIATNATGTSDPDTFYITDSYNNAIWVVNSSFYNKTAKYTTFTGIGSGLSGYIDTNNSDFWFHDENEDFVYHLNSSFNNQTNGISIFNSADGLSVNTSNIFSTKIGSTDAIYNKIRVFNHSGTNIYNITCDIGGTCQYTRDIKLYNNEYFYIMYGVGLGYAYIRRVNIDGTVNDTRYNITSLGILSTSDLNSFAVSSSYDVWVLKYGTGTGGIVYHLKLEDTVAPIISIIVPTANKVYNTDAMVLNLTANENLSTCVYKFDYFANNVSMTQFNSTSYYKSVSGINEGNRTLTYYCNDSYGNMATSETNITIDITPPNIKITTPSNGTNSTNNNLNINYTTNDTTTNLSSCWWTNDTGITNFTLTDCNTNITDQTWGDGTTNLIIYANDSVGNENLTFVTFTIDTTPPVIDIEFPTSFEAFTYKDNITINFTRSDALMGIDTCWYSNESGKQNFTLADSSLDNITVSEEGSGTFRVDIWCNDSLNNTATSYIDYVVSLDSPAVSLIYPTSGQWFSNGKNITFNYTSEDANGVNHCELYGNWTGTYSGNLTNFHSADTSVNQNEGNFSQDIKEGVFIWSVFCNDTTDAGGFSGSNFTLGVDETFPDINITDPRNITYKTTSLTINHTENDTNLGSCWWSDDEGATNNTLANCVNTTYTASQGSTNIIIWVNDSANNLNQSNATFFVDSINPSIKINALFSNNSYINYNTSIHINLSITDTNLNVCWYNINGTNTTFVCGNNITISTNESRQTIYVYANDTLNNINNSESYTFIPDATFPEVNITDITTTAGSQTFTFDFNATDTNLNSCWYSVFNSTGGIDPATSENTSISCNTAGNSETVSLESGTFNLTIYANDSANNEYKMSQQFTISTISPTIIGGGGGTPEVVKISVIGINATELSNLIKEIAFAEINRFCFEKSTGEPLAIAVFEGNCKLTLNDLRIIMVNIGSKGFNVDEEQMIEFFKSYKKKEFFQGLETEEDVIKFSLFSSILGELEPFTILPSSISKPIFYGFFSFSKEDNITIQKKFTSNRAIRSCNILNAKPDLNDNFTVNCTIISDNTFNTDFIIKDTEFFNKDFSAELSIISLDTPELTEIRQLNIEYNVFNFKSKLFGIPMWMAIIWVTLIFISIIILLISNK